MGAGNPNHSRIIPGQRFGKLTVVEMTEGATANDRRWLCRCDCGGETRTRGYKLNSGQTKSCGCAKHEAGRNRTHGKSGNGRHTGTRSPEYRSWSMMKDRCFNPNSASYANYGGRGITVCERWLAFEPFYADMGDRPSLEYSIDRFPDNNGNYEPGNCRWAIKSDQMKNRRNAVLLTHDGETLNLVDWAAKRGLDRSCISERLNLGWSVAQALGFESRDRYGARSQPKPPKVGP